MKGSKEMLPTGGMMMVHILVSLVCILVREASGMK